MEKDHCMIKRSHATDEIMAEERNISSSCGGGWCNGNILCTELRPLKLLLSYKFCSRFFFGSTTHGRKLSLFFASLFLFCSKKKFFNTVKKLSIHDFLTVFFSRTNLDILQEQQKKYIPFQSLAGLHLVPFFHSFAQGIFLMKLKMFWSEILSRLEFVLLEHVKDLCYILE